MVKPKGKKRTKSTKPFYAALGLIAIVGAGALAWVSTRPKAAPMTIDPKLPPLQAQGYVMGNPNAPVQVTEFADFECPACSQFATITEPDIRRRLVASGQMSFRFMDYPLVNIHRNTIPAHLAAACANEQGKFWEYHDVLFQRQDQWNGEATRNPKSLLKGYAQELGLNVNGWESCYDGQKYLRQIQANAEEGNKRNVGGTPTFVIGDKLYNNMGYDEFKRLVDLAFRDAAGKSSATPAPTGDTAAGRAVPVGGAAKPDTGAKKP